MARRALTRPIPGTLVAHAHTLLAGAAFASALLVGCALHYVKLCKNGVAQYPKEWFPSVSATIGDWYPERSIYQILIAITSGPRFALVLLSWLLARRPGSRLAGLTCLAGLVRTLSCGVWTYVTSTDDGLTHDVFMILYIAATFFYMPAKVALTRPEDVLLRKLRRNAALYFTLSMIPMIYFYIKHKVKLVPGAYTTYSFFEWGLIICDVFFDSLSGLELHRLEIQIKEVDRDRKTDSAGVQAAVAAAGVGKEGSAAANTAGVGFASSVLAESDEGFCIDALRFAADVYLAFVWWTVHTALPLTIFFYSVWALNIAGQEALMLVTLFSTLLGIPVVRRAAGSHAGSTALTLLSFAGLAAYAVPSTGRKLAVVAVAAALQAVQIAAEWVQDGGRDARHRGLVLLLGLLLSVIVKLIGQSNNPLWPTMRANNGGANVLGLTLALAALSVRATLGPSRSPFAASATPDAVPQRRGSWFLASLGLGGVLFALHTFLTDSGTLLSFTWTGYPLTGPTPVAHAPLIVFSAALGVLASFSDRLTLHPLWHALGAVSLWAVYALPDWLGGAGAAWTAAYVASLLPVLLKTAASGPPGRTLAVAWLVHTLMIVGHTFTVAYEFVPLGDYFRERTDVVFAITFVLLELGAYNAAAVLYPAPAPASLPSTSPRILSFTKATLLLLTLSSLAITAYRAPTAPPRPHHGRDRIVNAGIWTVHFGLDSKMWDSQRRMRDLIRDAELDVLGMLETDLHRVVYGNRDLTQFIAEDLGYYVDLGPPSTKHTWGAVLLSKFPIIRSSHHLLPSPQGELAPAIFATLDMYGTEVHVLVSHNGQEESPLDRELQTTELARLLNGTWPDPAIFLGYVVTKAYDPRPAPYRILYEDGRIQDIEQWDTNRWCEYIGFRALDKLGYARISRSTITDTELQVGKFRVPDAPHAHPIGQFARVEEDKLPKRAGWKFPDLFKGRGVRGHRFHVFGKALYYERVLPEPEPAEEEREEGMEEDR